jgi:hypothetical protein
LEHKANGKDLMSCISVGPSPRLVNSSSIFGNFFLLFSPSYRRQIISYYIFLIFGFIARLTLSPDFIIMSLLPISLKLKNLRVWDHGLVAQSLLQNRIVPRGLSAQVEHDAMGQIVPAPAPAHQLSKGTFSGTAKALTEVFRAGEERYEYLFEALLCI